MPEYAQIACSGGRCHVVTAIAEHHGCNLFLLFPHHRSLPVRQEATFISWDWNTRRQPCNRIETVPNRQLTPPIKPILFVFVKYPPRAPIKMPLRAPGNWTKPCSVPSTCTSRSPKMYPILAATSVTASLIVELRCDNQITALAV